MVRGRKIKTTIPDEVALRPADLVDRDFSATRPNERGSRSDSASEHPQSHAAGGEVLHGVDQMGEIATDTV